MSSQRDSAIAAERRQVEPASLSLPPPHWFESLKTRLAIMSAIIIAASVVVTGALLLGDMEHRAERAVLDSELGQVVRLAKVVSSRIVRLQRTLRAAATELPPSRLKDPPQLLATLGRLQALTDRFNSLSVIDTDGQLIGLADASGTRSFPISATDREYVIRTRRLGRGIVSDPAVSRVTGEPTIFLTMPLPGEGQAMLVGALKLADRALIDDLTSVRDANDDPVLTVIVDASGRIIAHPENAWVMRAARDEPRLAATMQQWIAKGRPIEPEGLSFRVDGNIVAMAGVPDADWVVLRIASTEVLLGGPQAGRQRALILGAAIAVIGGLLVLGLTARALRPLGSLQQRALRVLGNDLPAEDGWPVTRDEIGQLSMAFRHVMRERAQSQAMRDDLLARVQAVMSSAPIGITFAHGRALDLVSNHFGRMFGYDRAELEGRSARRLFASDSVYEAIVERVSTAIASGSMVVDEVEFVRRDGTRFWAHTQVTPVRADDPSAGWISITLDISESRRQRQQLRWMASHDPLTELANRPEFEALLAEQLHRRRGAEAACALFLDLDRFKAVNDAAGHAAGDAVLKDVARLLIEQVRDTDSVARLGGDEFAVLLRGCDTEAALRISEQIRVAIEEYRLVWHGQTFRIGMSVGVVSIDDSVPDVAAILAAADAACYAAKRAGRNVVRLHRPAA